MALLTRAHQVRRLMKNAGRMRDISTAMTRFGFGTLATRLGLEGFLPKSVLKDPSLEQRPLPVRLRLLLEQLGPTFIKLGQILSGRPDLVPENFLEEFKKLQDKVTPLPFLELKPILERSLNRRWEECFSSFDPEPLAIASIAQVHAARTLDGADVVVKIRKPGVEKTLQQDLEILEILAQLAEHYIPEIRPLRPRFLVSEFRRAILTELHFTLEANNVRRFAKNFENHPFLVIPKVYGELSSDEVLTLERLHGIKLSNVEAIRASGINTHDLLQKGMDCFFQSMLKDGFFHGDPHGGNLLVLPDARLGLVDFGLVGRLSEKAKDALVSMFLALLTQDYDLLVLEYMNMNSDGLVSRSSATLHALQHEVADVFAPYYGLPLKDIPMGTLLMQASGIALRHNISLPRDLVLVFKAIMTLEGIGRSLDPDFDLVSSASKYVKQLLRQRYSPRRLAKDALFMGRDMVRFLEKAPRQIGEALRQLENGDLTTRLRIHNWDALVRANDRSSTRIAMALMSLAFLLTASVSTQSSSTLPLWAQWSLWGVAGCSSLLTLWKCWR